MNKLKKIYSKLAFKLLPIMYSLENGGTLFNRINFILLILLTKCLELAWKLFREKEGLYTYHFELGYLNIVEIVPED